MEYRAWSRNFNMHFGYSLWPANPLALERKLEEMSLQVFRRIDLAAGMNVIDLGCGLGAPVRTLIAEHAVVVTAVTIVEWQIAKARAISEASKSLMNGAGGGNRTHTAREALGILSSNPPPPLPSAMSPGRPPFLP